MHIDIFSAELIRSIYDPEHPNTLEELRVVSAPQITIKENYLKVEFTPTVPHCGMSTLIGKTCNASVDVRLKRYSKVLLFVYDCFAAFPVGSRSIFSYSLDRTRASMLVRDPRSFVTKLKLLA